MEPPDGLAARGRNGVGDTGGMTVAELRGRRKAFYAIRRHFEEEADSKHGGDVWRLLAEEYPRMKTAAWAKFYHPMILLGYGVALEQRDLALDGIAYLHHTFAEPAFEYRLPNPSFGRGDLDLSEALALLGKGGALGEEMHRVAVDHVGEWEKKWDKDGGRIVAAADGMYSKVNCIGYSCSLVLYVYHWSF